MGTLNLSTFNGQKLYLDTNVFIYTFERYAEYVNLLDRLLTSIDDGTMTSITSEITLAECFVKPFADGDVELQSRYQAGLSSRPGLTFIPISRPVLIEAAKLRALHKFRLPDAIHVATALYSRCDAFITNDQLIRPIANLKIVQLADLTL